MRDPMNSAGVSIFNVDVENVDDRHNNELSDIINNAKVHILEQPNMGALRKARVDRNKTAMKAFSPLAVNHVFGKSSLGKRDAAAVCIQRYFRGYMARKEYVGLLYEQFEMDEAKRLERIRQQVEEGQIIVDNYHLKQEKEENDCLRRNKRRKENSSAVTIQRVWREYSDRIHGKLAVLRNGHGSEETKNGEAVGSVFNSFAISPFDDDFYEEDLFQQSEHNEENKRNSDEESNSEDERESSYSEPETKAGPSNGCLTRRLSENSEAADLNKELPPPSTDWESIDHCLNAGEMQSADTQYSPDPKVINRLSIGPDYLQLCFEDDNTLSDEEESHKETEIKEYIIEDLRDSKCYDDEKRDSGCIMKGDALDIEPVDVKIIKPEELENKEISEEDTTQVILQLEFVNKPEMDEKEADILRKKLERFSIRHLETQIRDLKLKVKEVSDELVKELLIRDQLHTRQDALLMDVEDAVKYAQTKHKLSKKVSQ